MKKPKGIKGIKEIKGIQTLDLAQSKIRREGIKVLHRMVGRRRKAMGLPPGSLAYEGERLVETVAFSSFVYTEETCVESRPSTVDEVLAGMNGKGITWINVTGLHDLDAITRICDRLHIHPLVQEDITNTTQRPKYEDYGNFLYIVVQMIRPEGDDANFISEQVSILVTRDVVVTFQEREGDVFEQLRERLRTGKGRVRKLGTDYLMYALLDAMVDTCFLVLEHVGEQAESLENRVMDNPEPAVLQAVHTLKTDLIFLRRNLWPVREVISNLERGESELVSRETTLFLRDVYDHAIQLIDTVETFRDIASGLFDMYLSSVSNRMNEVMKVLTIIATIFIPITFIAGVYGMNFEAMPELHWALGYPAALTAMAAVAVGMLVYFRRKEWL